MAAGCSRAGPGEVGTEAGLQVQIDPALLPSTELSYTMSLLNPLTLSGLGRPELVGCGEILAFRSGPPLGVPIPRQPVEPGPEGQIPWPELPEPSATNPARVYTLYLEARADLDGPSGTRKLITYLHGCACFRAEDRAHPDPRIDQAIREACPLRPAGLVPIPLLPRTAPDQGAEPGRWPEPVVVVGQRASVAGVAQATSSTTSADLAPFLVAVAHGDGPGPWELAVTVGETVWFAPEVTRCTPGEAELWIRTPGSERPPLRRPIRCLAPLGALRCGVQATVSDLGAITAVHDPTGRPELLAVADSYLRRLSILRPGDLSVADEMPLSPDGPVALRDVWLGPGQALIGLAEYLSREPVRITRAVSLDLTTGQLGEPLVLDRPCGRWYCGSGTTCDALHPCGGDEVCDHGRCLLFSSNLSCPVPPPGPAGCSCLQLEVSWTPPYLDAVDLNNDGVDDLLRGVAGSRAIVAHPGRVGIAFADDTCECSVQDARVENALVGLPPVADDPAMVAYASEEVHLRALNPEGHLQCNDDTFLPGRSAQLARGWLTCAKTDPSCAGPDLIVRSSSAQGGTTWLSLDRQGRPTLLGEAGPMDGPFEIRDLNGDGHDDVLSFRSEISGWSVYAGLGASNGGLVFVPWPIDCAQWVGRPTAIELNGDGLADLVGLTNGDRFLGLSAVIQDSPR